MVKIIVTIIGLILSFVQVSASGLDLKAYDTIAWKDAIINIDWWEPWKSSKIDIIKPDWKLISLFWIYDDYGSLSVTLSGYHTKLIWIYKLNLKSNLFINQNSSFEVFPWKVSKEKTIIKSSLSQASVGTDKIKIIVEVLDQYNNPIKWHKIKLLSSRFEDTYNDTQMSDESGNALFEVFSEHSWVSIYSAIDLTEDLVFDKRLKVVYYSSEDNIAIWWNPYLASLLNQNSWLLSNSDVDQFWPIDGFKVDANTEMKINSPDNFLQITAIDRDGFTVKDYQWQILISTPDDQNATLPCWWICKFTSEDQWSKRFDLSQVFTVLWNITIEVYEYENNKVNNKVSWKKTIRIITWDEPAPVTSQEWAPEIKSPASWTKVASDSINITWKWKIFTDLVVYINGTKFNEIPVSWEGDFNASIIWLKEWDNVIYVQEKEWSKLKSNQISVFADTTAPIIDDVKLFPTWKVMSESDYSLTIFSEVWLESIKVNIDWSIEQLKEKAEEPWTYVRQLISPAKEGDYPINAVLTDKLWNIWSYNKIIVLSVQWRKNNAPDKIEDIEWLPQTNEIQLKWSAPNSDNGIDRYIIKYWLSKSSLDLSWVVRVNDITIKSLQPSMPYYFSIKAVDKEWLESLWSSVFQFKTLDQIVSTRPKFDDVLTAVWSDSRATLTWKDMGENVTRFKISYWIKPFDLQEDIIVNNRVDTYNVDDLINWLRYYFVVTWIDKKWNKVTKPSNTATTVPNWEWFIKNWKSINLNDYIETLHGASPKTWPEVWFLSALILVVINICVKLIKKSVK